MKPKKASHVNIDKKRGLFLRIGFICSILFVILAFKWTTYEPVDFNSHQKNWEVDQTDLPPVIPKEKKEREQRKTQVIKEIDNNDPTPVDSTNFLIVDVGELDSFVAEFIEPEVEKDPDDKRIFHVVEDEPDFPGLRRYLANNIRYPEIERDNGVEGLVVVSFVVEKDGSLTDVRILKGVTPNINEESIRVVKAMPNWKPGKQRKKPVRVAVNLPINYRLE